MIEKIEGGIDVAVSVPDATLPFFKFQVNFSIIEDSQLNNMIWSVIAFDEIGRR